MAKIITLLGLALFLLGGCGGNGPCPDKSDYKGGKPPAGTEQWCEKTTEEGDVVLHGPFSAWHTAKQMQTEGQYVDGEKSGVWTNWHKNGKKKTQGTYELSSQEGKWTTWFENGQKEMEGNYVDDERTGTWHGWFKSGEKKDVGDWLDGQPSGKWVYFHKNGAKRQEGNRDNMGRLDGTWVSYHEDGKKKEEGVFKADKKIGIWKTWDEEGTETSVDMDTQKPAEQPKSDEPAAKKARN